MEYKEVIQSRMNKIKGQINGVEKMIDSDRECEDVLIQLSAINSALNAVRKIIVEEHISHCVVEGIKNGNEEMVVKNLNKILDQYGRLK